MPLFRKYQSGDFLLGIWKSDESVEQLSEMLLDFHLYESDLHQFTSEFRKHEWLSVRVLLQELTGGGREIAYCPSGKPYLPEGGYISISHTRGYVAVALHPTCEVGVDIEQYADRVKRVASRFIRPDEEPTLQIGDEIYTLLLHWSAKETLYKLMGEEGVDFLRHLHVMPFVPASEGNFKAKEYKTQLQKEYGVHYLTHPDFVLTWAIAEK